MSIWKTTPMLGFDIESTGTNTETARIVTCCVGLADPTKRQWQPKNWLLQQSEPIPAEATAIHGITTEQANADGTDPVQALAEIRDAIYAGWDRGWTLVAYNLTYDATLLDRELRRHGLGGFEVRGMCLDPMVIVRLVDEENRSFVKGRKYTLGAVAERFGVPLSAQDAHGAEADARAATRIAWKVCDVAPWAPDNRDATIRLGMEWQATFYRHRKLGLAKYFRRQGKEDAAVDCESRLTWPMEPHPTTTASKEAA